jgi:dolichol-phosphate mannosyltransferase
MIRFVIPAFNERENIPALMADLGPRAAELGARIIFVDDGSSDGTGEAILEHREGLHLAVVRHEVNRGLGTAINSGLRAALGEASDDDAIVTIEADNTSDLDDLPRMMERFHEGYDVVLASVYAPGGKIIGVAQWRLMASRAVSGTFRRLGGLRDVHTLSSLYRVYRAGTLRRAAETYGYLLVREPGFAANVELLLKLYNAGATVAEVPTVNDWSKRQGESKMSLTPTMLAYGRLVTAHLVGRIQPPPMSPLDDAPPLLGRLAPAPSSALDGAAQLVRRIEPAPMARLDGSR